MATVRYFVSDLDRSLAFYQGQLGFDLKERWGPAIALVTFGDLELWLSTPVTSAARPMSDGSQPVPGGWNRIVIQVADLEAKVTRLKESGAQFRNEIISGPGGRQILLDDPDGNPLELFEPGN